MTKLLAAKHSVDEKLTLEALKRVQQRLHRTEQRIEVVESELLASRELQLSVLKDLHKIYDLLGRRQANLGVADTVPPPPAALRREDDRKQ